MDTLTFTIDFVQYLLPDGKLSSSIRPFPEEINKSRLIEAYKIMRLVRAFDAKAIALQRTGKLGTYPSVLGQEAIGTAIGHAMQAEDIFTPYNRDIATQYIRGVKLHEILLYWGGNEQGSNFQQCQRDFPICVPIATQLGHAAGASVALKTRSEHQAVVVTCGEGATSKGDFLETLNLAGAWQLPLVVVVNNNQWAISTPRNIQCGAKTIAQKAIGAGIHGLVVDGNDYLALFSEVNKALIKARAGKGPTLIEAVTYRLGDHTTADDASRYRPKAELDEAWKNEPLLRFKRFLEQNYAWTESSEASLQNEIDAEIKAAVTAYLATPKQPPEAMFNYLYETLPTFLLDQYAETKAMNFTLNGYKDNLKDNETSKRGAQ